jgi:lysyl-tRNA synthetase class 2
MNKTPADEPYNADENRLVAERRQKLELLRADGPAFPNAFKRDSLGEELTAAYGAHSAETLAAEQITVRVAGRMMSKRIMGKNAFVHIQDRSGRIQLFIQRERLGEELYGEFKKWDLGDIVGARGRLMKTKTGELSVNVESLELLVKSLRPLPDKWHGIVDQELRLRQRYVDLIVSPETREVFRLRSQTISFIRSYLDSLDFLEVETPMMQPIPGGAAARPFETFHHALDQTLYLRIAPELYLKRLLVGGFERVYELGRVFRNEGLSTRHNPEFTMLELYQAYATYEDLMTLTEHLVREAARTLLRKTLLEYGDQTFDFGRPFPRLTLEQALIDAHDELDEMSIRDRAALRGLCRDHGVEVHATYGLGKLQLELFEKTVEPTLQGPLFITQYPAEVSPLARANDSDEFLTDRFELFVGGREIANGFSELNDPEDQAERFRAQVEAKNRGDHEAMYYDADYVRALEYGMPPAAGLGIGIDRLVMLLTNSASIRDVLLFPQLKPEH